MKLKYVIIDHCKPITFGEYFKHSDFSHMGEITSAGFCSIQQIPTNFEKYPRISTVDMFEVTCFGESISLGIKSNPSTDEVLIRMLYNN